MNLSTGPGAGLPQPDARRWKRILDNYSTPNHGRSVAELVITALPLVTLWIAAWFAFTSAMPGLHC